MALIIRWAHPALGQVSDAWVTTGQEAYHLRMYAPHEEWVEGAIRTLVYTDLSFKSGEVGK